jgi:hypothetical protein
MRSAILAGCDKQPVTVGFGSATCGFNGTLASMSVTWDPGSVRLLNIPMSINASRQGAVRLSFLATGATAATMEFMQATAFTSVVVSAVSTTSYTAGGVMAFYGCWKHSATMEQRKVGGAFVIEGTMELTFRDYSTRTDAKDRQQDRNGTAPASTNANPGQSGGAAYNKWDF